MGILTGVTWLVLGSLWVVGWARSAVLSPTLFAFGMVYASHVMRKASQGMANEGVCVGAMYMALVCEYGVVCGAWVVASRVLCEGGAYQQLFISVPIVPSISCTAGYAVGGHGVEGVCICAYQAALVCVWILVWVVCIVVFHLPYQRGVHHFSDSVGSPCPVSHDRWVGALPPGLWWVCLHSHPFPGPSLSFAYPSRVLHWRRISTD